MNNSKEQLHVWVEEMAALTTPDKIHWCDGSQGEYEALVEGIQHPDTE